MRMSFDDDESFKGAVESLRFNNASSDSNSQQQMRSGNSIPLEDTERNEDNITPSDPITFQRVGSSSSLSIQENRRSVDIQVSSDNLPKNPEFTRTSATKWDLEDSEVYGGHGPTGRRSQGGNEDAKK